MSQKSALVAAAEDVSSAEEDEFKRSRHRRRPDALTRITTHDPPAEVKGVQHITLPDEDHPHMRTIRELVEEYNYLDTEKKCEVASNKLTSKQRVSASSTSIEELRTNLCAVDHVKAASVNPWSHELFSQKLSALPQPSYYFRSVTSAALTHEQLLMSIKQQQVRLPLLDANYEQKLLAESGKFSGSDIEYPKCVNGEACVTNRWDIQIPDPDGLGKFISTALMYPEEYESLKNEGKKPVDTRPCILCCRMLLCDWILFLRTMRMANESHQTSAKSASNFDKILKNEVHQLYYNLMDRPGGYYRDYMLIPLENEVILDPICMFVCSPLKIVRLPNGRRCIDQRVMVWKSPELVDARIGENVSNFLSRSK